MKLHPDSHLDHGLSQAQVDYLFEHLAGHSSFFVATVDLPAELGVVRCDLVGPAVGDPPVSENEVCYEIRGTRTWRSRMVVCPRRSLRQVTVIAGPHDGEPCVLFTAFGGPLAPQEPDDPGCSDVIASRAFWCEHALIRASS